MARKSPILDGEMSVEEVGKYIDMAVEGKPIPRDIAEAIKYSYRVKEEASLTDPKTRLCNSRAFDRNFYNELSRQRRSRREYDTSIIGIDLDGFKEANDRLGHSEGDRILRMFSSILRNRLRSEDSAYRTGGDEFTLILPETGPKNAARILERLYDVCDERRERFYRLCDVKGIEIPDETREIIDGLGFSAGIATSKKEEIRGMKPTELNKHRKTVIERADEAMYENKMERKASR